MRMALHGQRNHPFGLPHPEPLSDAALSSITVPTSVIVAGKSAPFAPHVQVERAALIPGAVVDVVPGAGHEISWSHVDFCVDRLLVT